MSTNLQNWKGLLQDMANKCKRMIGTDIEYEDIKKSISLTKNIRNVYLYDVLYLYLKYGIQDSTNTRLYTMKITESDIVMNLKQQNMPLYGVNFIWSGQI